MSAVAVDIDRALLELPEADQRRAFVLLARSLFPKETSEGLTPIRLHDDEGRLIGCYIAFPEIEAEDFPPPSAASQAELERRFATAGETMPIEDFFISFKAR